MILVNIDIETTGRDPEKHQVLEIAIVIENTNPLLESFSTVEDLPSWVGRIRYDNIIGEPVALKMNADLIASMADPRAQMWASLDDACRDAVRFLSGHIPGVATAQRLGLQNGPLIASGKNVAGFDMRFMPDWFRKLFHYRTIDVGSVALGADQKWWAEAVPPSLNTLMGEKTQQHTALEDARDVVRVLRKVTKTYGYE